MILSLEVERKEEVRVKLGNSVEWNQNSKISRIKGNLTIVRGDRSIFSKKYFRREYNIVRF